MKQKAVKNKKNMSILKEKYQKQFQFFYSRSCFRGMTEYYKYKYTKFLEDVQQQKGILSKINMVEMNEKIEQFIKSQLGGVLANIMSQNDCVLKK